MPSSDSSRWWVAAEAAVAVALVALPWSFGGSPWWTTALLLACGTAAYGLWAVGTWRNHRRWGWHPALLLPAFGAALAVVHLVPLPAGALRLLSPPAFELREFALVPLGLDRLRPLSMDPASTARALARFLGLGLLLAAAFELGRREVVRHRLLAVLALTGVSIAVCGFGHLLADEAAFFGVHQFEGYVRFVTPFGNTNHLAAYLALTATIALALALDAERDAALGWGLAAAVCGVGVFLTFGRGGIAWFVVTWGMVGAAVLARRGGGLRAVLPWVVIAGTVAFAGLLAFEQLVDRADTVSSVEKLGDTKVALWPMLAHGALQYWPLGLGPGAFELGFARFQTELLSVTFTHPENVLLQWLAEAGVPLTVALAGLVLWLTVRLWRAVRERSLERYVFLALLGVVLHDVFDFALELNSLAPAAAVVLGLLASVERRGTAAPRHEAGARPFGLAVGAGLVGAVALASGLPTHLDAERALAAASRAGQTPEQLRASALTAIDRHPADWVLYANVASELARRGDPREALAWINRVLFLRPADPHPHVAAAGALQRLGRPLQALAEFKAAWALGDSSSLAAGLELARREQAWDRVLLDTRGHLGLAVQVLVSRGQVAEARALVATALEFPPGDEVAAEAKVLHARLEAEAGEPAAAVAMLAALPEDERTSSELQTVQARLLVKLGRSDEAVTLLEQLQAREPGNLALGLELAGVLASVGRPLAALEVVDRLKPFVAEPAARSRLFRYEGDLWAGQERWGRAIDAYQTATRIEPTRPELHYRLAELFERMGSVHSALDELRAGRTLDTPEGAKARDGQLQRLESSQEGLQ